MNIHTLTNAIMGRHRARAYLKLPVQPGPHPHGAFAVTNDLAIPAVTDLPALVHALRAPARPAPLGAPLQTLIGMLLDESGSMQTGRRQTIDGYNDQLATIRAGAAAIGCRVLQVNFHSGTTLVAEDAAPAALVPLSSDSYVPNGGTALYDTVAAVVNRLLVHPVANHDNTSILLTIMTDGDDTASTVWKSRDMVALRTLMGAVRGNDRWTVALAGPDSKLREFADMMCVDRGNVAAFVPDSTASRHDAMRSSVDAMQGYVAARSAGSRRSEAIYGSTISGRRAREILDRKPGE